MTSRKVLVAAQVAEVDAEIERLIRAREGLVAALEALGGSAPPPKEMGAAKRGRPRLPTSLTIAAEAAVKRAGPRGLSKKELLRRLAASRPDGDVNIGSVANALTQLTRNDSIVRIGHGVYAHADHTKR